MKIGYLWLVGGLCLAGCGKATVAEEGDKKTPIAVDLVVCKTGDVRQTLDFEGSFESDQGSIAKLSPGLAGRIKTVYAKEGDSVRKGQLLARLDPGVQNSQTSSAGASLRAAQAQLDQSKIQLSASKADQASGLASAQIALEQARSEGQNSVAQARFTLEQSQADLIKLRNGARPLEIAQVHEATLQASATLQRAKTELDRDEALWPQGYIAKKQLDDARTAVETATSAANAAKDSEDLLKSGARPEELRSAESKVAAAKDALRSARQVSRLQLIAAQTNYDHARSGQLSVSSKVQDIANNQALAAQKQADLATSLATAHLLEIRAPFDGKIVKRSSATGDPADPATPVFTIQKAGSHVDFAASGLPDQVSQINAGMTVQVSAKGKTYEGRVSSVSPPDATGNLPAIRISVDGVPISGAFGTAHIVLRTLRNEVLVPETAVVQKDGKNVIFKNANGTAKLTEVKLGPTSEDSVAVLSGLKAGDSVVASGGAELDDGAAITAKKADGDKEP